MRRPIGLGRMMCTSESHESMQGPGIADIRAAETGGGWVGESIIGHWSYFTGPHLHSPHAAASFVYSSALCLPRTKEIEQDAAVHIIV